MAGVYGYFQHLGELVDVLMVVYNNLLDHGNLHEKIRVVIPYINISKTDLQSYNNKNTRPSMVI